MKRWNVKQFAFRTFIEISVFSISNWQQHFQKSFLSSLLTLTGAIKPGLTKIWHNQGKMNLMQYL
jgi:hypothetical protein